MHDAEVSRLQRGCAREGCPNPAKVKWCSDRCKWAARPTETRDVAAAVRRLIQTLSDRVGDEDPASLRIFPELRALLDAAEAQAVETMRANSSCSWADVGEALGITRQSAHERYGRWRAS